MINSINPVTKSIFCNCPIDVMSLIFNRLDIKSFLQFEAVCHSHYSLTKHRWAYRRQEEKFLFDWSFLKDHSQIEKWSLVLPMLLMRYVSDEMQELKSIAEDNIRIAEAKKIQGRLGYLIERFPLWGCYIEKSLQELQASSQLSQIVSHWINYFSPSKPKQELAEKTAEVEWGGDLLLQGLFEAKGISPTSSDQDIQRVFDYFKKAIAKNATCACTLAFSVLNEVNIKWHIPLVIAAAEREDYDSLRIMHRDYPNDWSNLVSQQTFKGRRKFADYKAQIASLLFTERKLKEAESNFQEALEIYRGKAPIRYLRCAAELKRELGKFEEADTLLKQALEREGDLEDDIEAGWWDIIYANAISVKATLDQFKEVDALYARLLKRKEKQDWVSIGNQSPPFSHVNFVRHMFLRAMDLKFQASTDNFTIVGAVSKQIDHLYKQELEKEGDHAPVTLLNHAYIKFSLKEYEAADSLYRQALEKDGYQAPVCAFEHAIAIKLLLGRDEEAESLYTQAWKIYQEKTYQKRISIEALANMELIKASLRKYEGVD